MHTPNSLPPSDQTHFIVNVLINDVITFVTTLQNLENIIAVHMKHEKNSRVCLVR
jgi:hypothetical protein